MNISILIPQLFYDVIGRVLPGASLLASTFMLFRGGKSGLIELTTWSSSTTFVLFGNLLASHIIGSLLGGVWFRVYRLNLLDMRQKWQQRRQKKSQAGVGRGPKRKVFDQESKSNESQTISSASEEGVSHPELNEPQTASSASEESVSTSALNKLQAEFPAQIRIDQRQSRSNELQEEPPAQKEAERGLIASCLRGWAKNGENRVDTAFAKIFKEKKDWPRLGEYLNMGEIEPTARMALMYDYTQLRCPRAGARIAKLRAEQHMSGVLMIGFLGLAVLYPFFSPMRCLCQRFWGIEMILLFGMTTAGWLTWHLEKRAGAALFYSWYLAWSANIEENRNSDSPKQ